MERFDRQPVYSALRRGLVPLSGHINDTPNHLRSDLYDILLRSIPT
jgi:hypothetical protein